MITIIATGHIGNDAEETQTEKGFWINFSMAAKNRKETIWIKVSKFSENRLGITDYLKKGTLVEVTGIPIIESYENKNGETVSNQCIKFPTIGLLSARATTQDPTTGNEKQEKNQENNDDLPF